MALIHAIFKTIADVEIENVYFRFIRIFTWKLAESQTYRTTEEYEMLDEWRFEHSLAPRNLSV